MRTRRMHCRYSLMSIDQVQEHRVLSPADVGFACSSLHFIRMVKIHVKKRKDERHGAMMPKYVALSAAPARITTQADRGTLSVMCGYFSISSSVASRCWKSVSAAAVWMIACFSLELSSIFSLIDSIWLIIFIWRFEKICVLLILVNTSWPNVRKVCAYSNLSHQKAKWFSYHAILCPCKKHLPTLVQAF